LLGLTQYELAAMAQVSQPAISRLEREANAWTPLATVERVRAALDRALGANRARLGPRAVHMLGVGHEMPPATGTVHAATPEPLVADTLVDALVRIALRVDRRQRPAFLGVVEAAAEAMERPIPQMSASGARGS
jgi:transcriptional regulator with XRE-family HTH domain